MKIARFYSLIKTCASSPLAGLSRKACAFPRTAVVVGLIISVIATAYSTLELTPVHAELEPPTCTPPTTLRISEFRLRGAAGPNDEFIEFYNSSDSQITVCTADGSSGWALAARNAAGTTASIVFVIHQ
ncbi:MAG TPA: hypothetical protein VFX97_13050 [Pyrinomonadaceae bacterium]|nr:hypothetical protein [Pyrinomonadaceae bacterium]